MIKIEDIIENNEALKKIYYNATIEQIQMMKNIVKVCDRFCLRKKQIEYMLLEAIKPYIRKSDKQ